MECCLAEPTLLKYVLEHSSWTGACSVHHCVHTGVCKAKNLCVHTGVSKAMNYMPASCYTPHDSHTWPPALCVRYPFIINYICYTNEKQQNRNSKNRWELAVVICAPSCSSLSKVHYLAWHLTHRNQLGCGRRPGRFVELLLVWAQLNSSFFKSLQLHGAAVVTAQS